MLSDLSLPRLGALEEDVARLQSEHTALLALGDCVSALEARVTSLPSPSPESPMPPLISTLEACIFALESLPPTPRTPPSTDKSHLSPPLTMDVDREPLPCLSASPSTSPPKHFSQAPTQATPQARPHASEVPPQAPPQAPPNAPPYDHPNPPPKRSSNLSAQVSSYARPPTTSSTPSSHSGRSPPPKPTSPTLSNRPRLVAAPSELTYA